MKHTRIEIRACITLPFHGMVMKAGGSTPADKEEKFFHESERKAVGIEKGKIIGKIHATQRFLKRRITSEKKLISEDADELKAILRQLEAELRIV